MGGVAIFDSWLGKVSVIKSHLSRDLGTGQDAYFKPSWKGERAMQMSGGKTFWKTPYAILKVPGFHPSGHPRFLSRMTRSGLQFRWITEAAA